MIDVFDILERLEESRQLFHSEADFQHEFAWKIHEQYEDVCVRLEYPVPLNDKRLSLDVWLKKNNSRMAIELKYKTQFFKGPDRQGENFHLRNQNARDQGRYDFLKDIQRLETLKRWSKIDIGCAILLTNDCGYWDSPDDIDRVGGKFYVTDGRTLPLHMEWNNAGAGTVQGREDPIELEHQYNLTWKKYSHVGGEGYGEFRYLLVTVE